MKHLSPLFTLKRAVLAVALATAMVPAAAQAWTFSGDVLVHKSGVARRNLKNGNARVSKVRVTGEMVLYGKDADQAARALKLPADKVKSGSLDLNATATYIFPGQCLLELTRSDSQESIRLESKGGVDTAHTGGEDIRTLEMFQELACPLLDGRGGYEGPMALVRKLGIRRADVSMGRNSRNDVAYVIGSTKAADQETRSTLWIQKDTFQPMGIVDRNGGNREVRFLNYKTPASGEWHPQRIEFLSNGMVTGTLLIDKAVPNFKK